jgi:valyl-tRNA synthetase
MDKTYNPQEVEPRIYKWWEEQGYFKPRLTTADGAPNERPPFVISMPPPNVTGSLHLGHALTMTIEDIMIRYHRMTGDPTLWIPGSDHAGIATQIVVERELRDEGTDRYALGRERFVERVWDWKRRYGSRISEQNRRLGVSCDWDRERFTLDAGLSAAVREVFVRLHEEGLIYRDDRIINWCPRCASALSDLEVEHEDRPGKLYHVAYPLADGSGQITVATTRPETILGDTAIAVHPDDPRYKDLVGRDVVLPAVGRHIPIVADDAVEQEFGTGAVKVTPAHDPTDFEIGARHHLPRIQVIGFDARMTAEAGPYVGLDRYEARERLLTDLDASGALAGAEDYTIPIGTCERCGTVIEPLISKQWFVHMPPLAAPAIAAVREGRTTIIPERFTKTYFDWMENIHDWCISRQLWWGHRIPAWYCPNGHITVDRADPTACATCGSPDITQDPDVLDTWFSSQLWPFSTLGWPEQTDDLRRFYPTSVMETAYDILFFWVARMMMAGLHFTGEVPFHTVYLHGLVLDEKGEKMSKSKGNGIDPLDVIDAYGTDALRFTLATSSAPGNNMKFVKSRVEGNRNFATKLWNAARYVLSQVEAPSPEGPATDAPSPEGPRPATASPLRWGPRWQTTGAAAPGTGETPALPARPQSSWSAIGVPTAVGRQSQAPSVEGQPGLSLADRWITSSLNRLIADTTALIEDYQFGEAGRQIYDFFWSQYCDWYLETAKIQLRRAADGGDDAARRATLQTLVDVLGGALRLLHPYMPFITEEIYQQLPAHGEALIVASWPATGARDEAAERDMALIIDLVGGVRTARAELNIEPRRKLPALVVAPSHTSLLDEQRAVIEALAGLERLDVRAGVEANEVPAQSLHLAFPTLEVYLPLEGVIDMAAERARTTEEIARVEKSVAGLRGRLGNPGFTAKAPEAVVAKERERLTEYEELLARLQARVRTLSR